MRNDMIKWLVLVMILTLPLTGHAAKYGILHLKPVGVSEATAETAANLLAGDLIGLGHTVFNPDAMDAAAGMVIECYQTACAADAGAVAGVERVIYGSVSTLGDKHIVQVSVVSVATRNVVWAGSLAAKSAEDLDTVMKRLAKSISEGKKVEETVEVGMVTEEEEKEPARRRSFHTTGIKVGAMLPLGGYADASYLMHYGVQYWYEMPNFAIEVAGYYSTTGNIGYELEGAASEFVAPEISVLYLMSKGDISPYFGGGFGLGIISLTPEGGMWDLGTGLGPAFNAGAGIVFFRTYDIRITADIRYRVNFARVTGLVTEDPMFEGPHHGIAFSIGLSYRPKQTRGCGGGGCGGGGCINLW